MARDSSSSDTLERLEKAERLKLMGKNEEALAILEQLLIEDPENIAALEEVADNYLGMEELEKAKTAAKQAITLDDKSYTGHYILGFIYSQKKEWEQSTEHLQKANTTKPNNPEILRCLGWTLFNAGQRAQGIVTLERSLNLDPENIFSLCDLGVSYLQVRNFPKAKALFIRASDLDPENARVQECVEAVQRMEKEMKKTA